MQDKLLLERAKRMRHEATPAEVVLWRHLSGSRLGGHKFRRQHVIGNRIVDFFCPAKGVVVEVDGITHDPVRDTRRDELLAAKGFVTIRFSNAEVMENVSGCLERLLALLERAPDRWPGLPHPNPVSGRPASQPGLNRAGRGSPDTPEGEGLH